MDRGEVQVRFTVNLTGFWLDVDLRLPGQGVTAIFGPSGSGKTTLLRCIAGLQHADGRLVVNGVPWQDAGQCLPPHQRPLGYVFQEARLFGHLSVRGNLDYALRRVPVSQRRVSLSRATELLEIDPMLSRQPDSLSGGERQRVAIARALLTSPRLLMMDEPLASLDMARRQEILPYLERLHRELDIPVLYVSHATDEVARLADHLVVLEHGRVVADGAMPDALAGLDWNLPLGEELGVVLSGKVVERDTRWHLTKVDCGGTGFWVRDEGRGIGEAVRLRVLARDVSLALHHAEDSSILNVLPAVVSAIREDSHPAQAVISMQFAGATVLARLTRRSADSLGLASGTQVYAQIKAVAVLA